jgi:hypothetical protein
MVHLVCDNDFNLIFTHVECSVIQLDNNQQLALGSQKKEEGEFGI